MASINTKNVHRSNALLGHLYGQDFVYDEMVFTGGGEQGQMAAQHVANTDLFGKNPPKPGEGPSKEERENGFYEVAFFGTAPDGTAITASVSGDKDPGYGSTSKMIAEAALCLAQDIDKAACCGGIYTTAPAMGEALIKRLSEKAGLRFKIE